MRQEQIDEIYECIKYNTGSYDDDARSCAEILYNYLGYRKYEWISVKDRLPELESSLIKYGSMGYKQKSIRVLCACKQKSGRVMVKEGYCEVWVDNPTNPYWRIPGSIDSITHWMPLPTPPTEKEN